MSSRLTFVLLTLGIAALMIVAVVVVGIRLVTLETPQPPARTKERYYVIRRGDSLSAIAQRTGVPVDELSDLNPEIDPLGLVPRQRLRLRASVPPASAVRRRARRQGPRQLYYVVKRGDALALIADRTGVPIPRLIALNRGIRPNRVVPGQRIKLRRRRPPPRLPPDLRSLLRIG